MPLRIVKGGDSLSDRRIYRILIIDDFVADRETLAGILGDFSDLSVCVTGECEDALQARDRMHELEPDIVICDIQMPYVNGLAFARDMADEFPGVRFIFCTLYDNFDYVREALRLHSAGYLLKPVDVAELRECVVQAIGDIENRLRHDRELQALRENAQSNLDMLCNAFYHDLVCGLITDSAEIDEKLEMLSLKLADCTTFLALIEIDDFERTAKRAGVARPIVTMKVLETLKRLAGLHPLSRGIRLDDAHFAYIRSFRERKTDTADFLSAMTSDCQQFLQRLRMDGLSATAAVGSGTCDLLLLQTEFRQCRHQLRFKYTLGSGRVITSVETPGSAQPVDINLNSIIREVRYLLSCEDDSPVEPFIEGLLAPVHSPALCQGVAYSLVLSVMLAMREYDQRLADPYGGGDVWEQMQQFETIGDLRQYCLDLIRACRKTLSDINEHKRRYLIEKIRHHIETADPGRMNLQSVAAEFHYSPNHINSVFKRETGQTISDYITVQRIQKAKKLLSDPGARLFAVATELGYSHAAHFNNVFKKYVGISPREYRNGRNEQLVSNAKTQGDVQTPVPDPALVCGAHPAGGDPAGGSSGAAREP